MKTTYIFIFIGAIGLVLLLIHLRYGSLWFGRKQDCSWEERICTPGLTQEQFTELYAEALKQRLGNAEVEISDVGELRVSVPGSETKYHCWLGNAWLECSQYPERRAEVSNRYLDSFARHLCEPSGVLVDKDVNAIVPVMNSTEFINNLPLQGDGTKPIVAEHLVADIWILYAWHLRDKISYITQDDLSALNMTMSEIRAAAVRNLRQKLSELRIYGEESIHIISADGNYEPGLLLIDKLWESEKINVAGDVVAAIPCRGMLIVTGSEDHEGIEKVRAVVDKMYGSEPHGISTTLLVRKGGKWEPFGPSHEDP